MQCTTVSPPPASLCARIRVLEHTGAHRSDEVFAYKDQCRWRRHAHGPHAPAAEAADADAEATASATASA
eukprot:5582931-Alexandrium_andersonii.AAC.1